MSTKCGIICEYNPFHNGHAYHLSMSKEYAEEIVCIMSGDFVQRAEPAIFDKRNRAYMALKSGADAVIELPCVFSTAGARQFANGAVEILSGINGLKYISFGVENCPKELILTIADIQLDESAAFKNELNSNLKKGQSYALSYSNATKTRLIELKFNKTLVESALNGPNNLLAVEYIKTIKQKGLKIEPIFVNRSDSGYNSNALNPPYASASAIRTLINSGVDYSQFVPQKFDSIINFQSYNSLIRFLLLQNPPQDVANNSQSVLDNKIYLNAKTCTSLEAIIDKIKSKSFTYSHIKRRILQIALGITQPLLDHNSSFHTRLIGIKKSFKPSLKDLPKTILIKASDFNAHMGDQIFKIEKTASDLYACITNQTALRFYNQLLCL